MSKKTNIVVIGHLGSPAALNAALNGALSTKKRQNPDAANRAKPLDKGEIAQATR